MVVLFSFVNVLMSFWVFLIAFFLSFICLCEGVKFPNHPILLVSLPWRSNLEPMRAIAIGLHKNKMPVVLAVEDKYASLVEGDGYPVLLLPPCKEPECMRATDVVKKVEDPPTSKELNMTSLVLGFMRSSVFRLTEHYKTNTPPRKPAEVPHFLLNKIKKVAQNSSPNVPFDYISSFFSDTFYYVKDFFSGVISSIYNPTHYPEEPGIEEAIKNHLITLQAHEVAMYSALLEFAMKNRPSYMVIDRQALAGLDVALNLNISYAILDNGFPHSSAFHPYSTLSYRMLEEIMEETLPAFLIYASTEEGGENWYKQMERRHAGMGYSSNKHPELEFVGDLLLFNAIAYSHSIIDLSFSSRISVLLRNLKHKLRLIKNWKFPYTRRDAPSQSPLILNTLSPGLESSTPRMRRILSLGPVIFPQQLPFTVLRYLDNIRQRQIDNPVRLIVVYFETEYALKNDLLYYELLNGLCHPNHYILILLSSSQRSWWPPHVPERVNFFYITLTTTMTDTMAFFGTNVPVSSVLDHPAVSLFVTSGALSTVQSALYFGIPCLLLPASFEHREVAFRLHKLNVVLTIERNLVDSFLVAWSIFHLLSPRVSVVATELAQRMRKSHYGAIYAGVANAVNIIQLQYELAFQTYNFSDLPMQSKFANLDEPYSYSGSEAILYKIIQTHDLEPSIVPPVWDTPEDDMSWVKYYSIDVYFVFGCVLVSLLVLWKMFWVGLRFTIKGANADYTKPHMS